MTGQEDDANLLINEGCDGPVRRQGLRTGRWGFSGLSRWG
ncbi:hypothetical protein PSN13_00072 [Micromonospora saelicesensis]|uniref:Uncharacterized protein n=1 Tax=Micromonospora saelicesensis TaxID=285676 RepID=A0A328NT66_9ACTN|nr:hypothetical protein PSN13_00072 [Micromonospora saelicesensis]